MRGRAITVAVAAALAQFVWSGSHTPFGGGQTVWVALRVCNECRRYDFKTVVLQLISSSLRLAHSAAGCCFTTFTVRDRVLRLIPNKVVLLCRAPSQAAITNAHEYFRIGSPSLNLPVVTWR